MKFVNAIKVTCRRFEEDQDVIVILDDEGNTVEVKCPKRAFCSNCAYE